MVLLLCVLSARHLLKTRKKAAAAAAIDAVNAVMPEMFQERGRTKFAVIKIVVKLSGIFYLGGKGLHSDEEIMSEALVRIFENVVLTEEKSLQAGYFSNLSIAEMHTLTAMGPYGGAYNDNHRRRSGNYDRYTYRRDRQTCPGRATS